MPKAFDMRGHIFGRLTVTAQAGRSSSGKIMWKCRCSCGRTTTVSRSNLITGNTKSCGCLNAEMASAWLTKLKTKHGRWRTPEWTSWERMLNRCYNSNYKQFHYWGGRGISVCPEWRDSFESFFTHIGPRPSPKHTLDRYPDKDGDYRPGNVRWATRKQQAANRRNPYDGHPERREATGLAMKRVWRERRETMMKAAIPC